MCPATWRTSTSTTPASSSIAAPGAPARRCAAALLRRRPAAAMTTLQAVDVDEVLELVVRDERAAAAAPPAASTPVRGELVSPGGRRSSREFALTLVASPQTQRTYDRACRAFAAWLGRSPGPGPDRPRTSQVYHADLVRSGLRELHGQEGARRAQHLPALARRVRAHQRAAGASRARGEPAARTAGRPRRGAEGAERRRSTTICCVRRRRRSPTIRSPARATWRSCSCSATGACAARSSRACSAWTSSPRARARSCARSRSVTARAIAAAPSSSASARRARSCAGSASAPPCSARRPATRRCSSRSGAAKADGSYAGVGRRCGQPALAAVIKRLGALAKIPAELCHPHALRHTCATELLRTGANIADVRTILGHASIKTTVDLPRLGPAAPGGRRRAPRARRPGPRRGPRR